MEVVITTGGTGITGRDGTPEAIAPLLDKEIEGFGELFRTISYDEIGPSSLQSRCLAGVANATYVFCLPGSANACATGWDELSLRSSTTARARAISRSSCPASKNDLALARRFACCVSRAICIMI